MNNSYMHHQGRCPIVETNRIQLAEPLVGMCSTMPINQVTTEAMLQCSTLSKPIICIQTGNHYEVVANVQTLQLAIQAKVKRLRVCVVDACMADTFISYELVCHPAMNYLEKVSEIGARYRLATKLGLKGLLSALGEAFQSQVKLAKAINKAKNTVFPSNKSRSRLQQSSRALTSEKKAGDYIKLGGSSDAED